MPYKKLMLLHGKFSNIECHPARGKFGNHVLDVLQLSY